MELEIFSLCDAATQWAGKLNILGAFDAIQVRQFPAVHPLCAIALRIRFERIEEGEHTIKITLNDVDGEPVLPAMDGKVNVHFGTNVPTVCANMVLNLNQVKFEKAGNYTIRLAIDGRQERSIPLRVSQRAAPRPAQPPLGGPVAEA